MEESLDGEALVAARLIDGIAGYECELSCFDDGETLYDNLICYAVMPEVF